MKPVFDKNARLVILNSIFENFVVMLQNSAIFLPDEALVHLCKAESLIEILEIDDCGNIGGNDRANLVDNVSNCREYNRFLALVKKYHSRKDIKARYGVSINDATKMFKKKR